MLGTIPVDVWVTADGALTIRNGRTWETAEIPLSRLTGWMIRRTLESIVTPIFAAAERREEDRKRTMLQSQRNRIRRRDGNICHYCRAEGTHMRGPDRRHWHVDHVVPVVAGGKDVDDNLVLACATCNLRKGALSYEEFARA